jgi:hypothetical protein
MQEERRQSQQSLEQRLPAVSFPVNKLVSCLIQFTIIDILPALQSRTANKVVCICHLHKHEAQKANMKLSNGPLT